MLGKQQAEAVIAGKGYHSDEIVAKAETCGAIAVTLRVAFASSPQLRPKTLRAAQSYRTLLQQAQAVPPFQHPQLQNRRSLPLFYRSRLCLAQTELYN